MFSFFPKTHPDMGGLSSSSLYDENTFYKAFIRDLNRCTSEVIIESPFITGNRVASLLPIFSKMRSLGIRITVNTRHPAEHDAPFETQAREAIDCLLSIGVQVLYTGGHHRKLSVIDRSILWEGSLNILSQNNSCEIMRRIESQDLALQMISFTKLNKFLN